jgi:hypothetical protein
LAALILVLLLVIVLSPPPFAFPADDAESAEKKQSLSRALDFLIGIIYI